MSDSAERKSMRSPAESQSNRVHQAVQAYDQQRRFIANRLIALAFAILLGSLTLIFVVVLLTGRIRTEQPLSPWLIVAIFLLCLGGYSFSLIMAHFRHLTAATTLTLVATDVAITIAAVLWIFVLSPTHEQVNPVTYAQFSSLNIAILLAGVLGEWWLTIVTASIMSLLTVVITSIVNFHDTTHIFLPLIIVQQWGIATIAITIALLYRRNLTELGQAYIQTQELDTLKDQFITHVNHELRTPIMALQGYIELMRISLPELPPETVRDIVERASRTSFALLNLLNSILEIRRIDGEHADYERHPILVQQIVTHALDMVDPRDGTTRERSVQQSIKPNLALLGEPFRVQQIITNLISNALKYSEPGTPIEIIAQQVMATPPTRGPELGRHPRMARKMCELQIRDHGLGIPPEQIGLLFNRFARLPRDLASQVVGNGLGLYLCKMFAEELGGWIFVESTGVPGEGATFHVLLPLAENEDTVPRLRAFAMATRPQVGH